MNTYEFFTCDVFTDRLFGGNPLAIVLDPEGRLGDDAMQKIAREFNLSETVFVGPARAASEFPVRIFTPAKELPFAGHPTIGSALTLAEIGNPPSGGSASRLILHEGIGPVTVDIEWNGDRPAFARLTAARSVDVHPEAPETQALAEVLGIDAGDIGNEFEGAEFAPATASGGVPFLMVPVRNRSVLGTACIRRDAYDRVFANMRAGEVYVFCFEPEHPGAHVRSRMFAPALGIPEDPATGAAAVAFAGYLAGTSRKIQTCPDGRFEYRIEQGVEMGRPSYLDIRIERRNGDTLPPAVGGGAVQVSRGTLRIP